MESDYTGLDPKDVGLRQAYFFPELESLQGPESPGGGSAIGPCRDPSDSDFGDNIGMGEWNMVNIGCDTRQPESSVFEYVLSTQTL